MKNYLLILLLFLVVDCTKTEKKEVKITSEKPQTIPFDSLFKFQFDPALKKTEQIVVAGDVTLNEQQLFSNDPALSDLNKQSRELMLATAYKLATELLKRTQSSQSVTLSLPASAEATDWQALLTRYTISENEKVVVDYSIENSQSIKINGKAYSEDALAKTNFAYSQNRQKMFYLKMKRIEERVARYLVTDEAKKSDMDLNQYIGEKISGGIKVTDEEAKQYGIENNVPAQSIDSEMLARLKLIVESKQRSQKLLEHAAQIMGEEKVKIAFNKPTLELNTSISEIEAPQRGNGDVQVIILSNFLCTDCRLVETTLEEAIGSKMNQVNVSYVFNFKPEDRSMRMVAEAALCVETIDKGKFWDFKDKAEVQDFDGSENKINTVIEELGLSPDEFRKCFLARKTKEVVDAHVNFVKNLGHLMTPAILVQGRVFEGTTSQETLAQGIEEALIESKSSMTMKSDKGLWGWIKGLFS